METILIQAMNTEEAELVRSFLQENRIKARVLTAGDKEDIILGRLMEETYYEEVIDTNTFLTKLRG